jgi:type III secretory pathway lipoprotein EscJ
MPSAQAARPWIALWKGFKTPQRVGIAAIGALFVGGLILLVATSARDDGMVRLDQSRKPEIAAALASSGIRFETRADGIYVPRADHERAVVLLFTQGATSDPVIFEQALKAPSFTDTARSQSMRSLVALQEKLRVMLKSLDHIEDAKVQVSPAEPSATLGSAGIPAKASVVLTLRGRPELAHAEARGIANLVSAAVRGLEPKNVTVMDRSMRAYDFARDDVRGADDQELDRIKRRREEEIERKAIRILSHFPDVRVSVTVELTGRTVERRFEEQGQSVAAPQKNPLDVSMDGGIKGATDAASGAEGVHTSKTRTEEREFISPSAVRRVTMSVVIPTPDGGGASEKEILALLEHGTGVPRQNIALQLKPAAAAAASASVAAPPAEPASTPAETATVSLLLPGAGVGAGLAIALGLLALGLRRSRRTRRAPSRAPASPQGADLEDLREFVARRMAANPELGARVLAELGPERAAVVLSQLDEPTAARAMELVPRTLLFGIAAASTRLRSAKPPTPAEALAVLTQCAEALVIPR